MPTGRSLFQATGSVAVLSNANVPNTHPVGDVLSTAATSICTQRTVVTPLLVMILNSGAPVIGSDDGSEKSSGLPALNRILKDIAPSGNCTAEISGTPVFQTFAIAVAPAAL